MSVISLHPTAAPRTSAGTGLLVRLFDALIAWQDRAGQRRQLATLDDYMLTDIGLSRGDVEQEAAKPFWRV